MLSGLRGQRESFRQSHRRRSRRSAFLRVEELESRFLFSAGGLDNIFAAPDRGPDGGRVTNPIPVGYDPAQIRHAYGFDQITFSNGVKGDGTGQTIAIVDAYDDPNIFKDVNVFDNTFGLPGPASSFLTKATPQGHTKTNASWAGEISLDVEWAHAIAPAAKILLVEAANSSLSNLLGAVSYANKQPGVVAVSMSWGGGEFSAETLYDSYFTAPGITYTAASGDSPGVIWPSASPNVLSVGGTSLAGLNSAGDYSSATETGWSSSGGGTSAYESRPSYQSGTNTTTRANPDVAFEADPNTGVAIYDTVAYFGQTGWFQVGGTSLGAPAWAALVAIADQGRSASLGSAQTLSTLYAHPSDFHYIGSSAANTTAPGYNLVTGLGTPIANLVVQSLVTAPALKTAAAQASTTTSTADKTSSSNGTRSVTAADTTSQTLGFFLFLSTQPQITYGPVTPVNSVSVPVALPAASAAVFVPPSFTAVGSTSGSSGGFGSAGDYFRGGLGPVLPAPENQQPPDSSPGRPALRIKPEQAPGDSPSPSPQKDQSPAMPDGKKQDSAPGDGFWDGTWAVDGATLGTNDDGITESVQESAALIPGLVAFLSGSWGVRLVDSDSKKSELQEPKSESNRADL